MLRSFVFFAACAFLTALAACAPEAARPFPNAPSLVSRAPRQVVYVAQNLPGAEEVGVYEPDARTRLALITQNLTGPTDVTVDSHGNMWVANYASVSEFAPGALKPKHTITSGILGAVRLLTDSAGTLYVGCAPQTQAGYVAVFENGSSVPSRVITEDVAKPYGLALDTAGNLYVANLARWVSVYPANGSAPIRKITDRLHSAWAIAFDGKGNLYVADGNANAIQIYPPNRSLSSGAIRKGLQNPQALLFDKAGNLYVANAGHSFQNKGSITIYAPGEDKPRMTLVHELWNAHKLAMDAAGNLYAVNSGEPTGRPGVSVFEPGQDWPSVAIKMRASGVAVGQQ